MVDTNTDRPANNGQDTGPDTISVMEAARRLNVTPDAVRARIRRGTLNARKAGGTWHVIMPADTDDTTQQDTEQDTTPATDPTAASLVELIADLSRRNTELAGAAAAWQARAGFLEERLKELTAGTTTTPETGHDASGSPQSDGNGPTQVRIPATPDATRQDAGGGFWERVRRLFTG